MTGVINYLFNKDKEPISPQKFCNDIEVDIDMIGLDDPEGIDVGNKELIKFFKKYSKKKNLSVNAKKVITETQIPEISKDEIFSYIVKIVQDPKKALIYHTENHYILICGFFESSKKSDATFNNNGKKKQWIILADPDPEGVPIRTISLKNLIDDIDDDIKCVMEFSVN